MAYFSGLHTAHGLAHVPGRYATERGAHAAARNVAHVAGLHHSEFQTVACPAPSAAATVALVIAAALFALAPCVGFFMVAL